MTRGAFEQLAELDVRADPEVLEDLNDALYGSGYAVVVAPGTESDAWLVEVTTA